MKPQNPAVSDADLQAWVDGRLATAQRELVDAALDADPQLNSTAHAYVQINRALREHLDADLDQPVPPALALAAAGAAPSSAGGVARVSGAANGARFAQAAALVVAVAIGAAGGWSARSARDTASPAAGDVRPAALPLTRAAVIAHAAYAPEVRHPVEVGAGEQAHLVAWLSKRLGTQLTVPHLESQGFRLMGGRLLPDAGRGVAAQFMFDNAQGRRLTLFVRADETGSDTAFRYAASEKLSTFYWVDRGFGYALSGELSREAILAVATEVYRQINP